MSVSVSDELSSMYYVAIVEMA
ncbi:hypothetical protein IKM_05851, partial [Bacillus mycoides]